MNAYHFMTAVNHTCSNTPMKISALRCCSTLAVDIDPVYDLTTLTYIKFEHAQLKWHMAYLDVVNRRG